MIKKLLRKWLLEEAKASSEPEIDIDAERTKFKDSNEPWCQVVGEGIIDGQLKLELDWNDAFIEFLLENGFTGKTDEEIVAKWMLMVHRELDESNKQES